MVNRNCKCLKVGLFNAGSLGTKHDELHMAIANNDPDVLAINETWLRVGEEGRAPTITGYRLRHLPRPPGPRVRGGGVGFYIKRGIHVRIKAHPPSPTNTEQMWLSMNVKSVRLLIGTAYRPPWFNVDEFFDALTDSIATFTNYDKIILLGDFNINWMDGGDSKTRRLRQFLECTSLTNCVTEPTHFTSDSSSLIDLVCTDALVQSVVVDYTPELGGHAMVLVELKLKRNKILPKKITYRPIKDIDMAVFNMELELIDWDQILLLDSVNDMVLMFNDFILQLFDRHAPIKCITVKEAQRPWFTENVRYLMRLRDQAHKEFHLSRKEEDRDKYKTLKHLANVSLFYEKKAFFNQKINCSLQNPKQLWKELTKSELSFKKNADLPDHLCDPDVINDHFLKVPGRNDANISVLTRFEFDRYCTDTFRLQTVHENEVAKHIFAIKSNAKGCDSIDMNMIVLTLPRTLNIITAIINRSILTSSFPSIWKCAVIRPIPKNNTPNDIKDLRPISLLPYLSKLLERVVYGQLQRYCERNNILPSLQSGFRKQRSTATALLDVVDNILSCQDEGRGTLLALLDFSRAFDSINVAVMLSKMLYYGFDHNTISWFNSYLVDRYQKVVIQKADGITIESDLKPVSRGVPQGSILGPLLFIMYSADIVKCIINCKYHLYADDLQVYISSRSEDLDVNVMRLNEDLNRVSDWCDQNCLFLNPAKSKFLIMGSRLQIRKLESGQPSVRINGIDIERVSNTRNLGLQMDDMLNFESHILGLVRTCFYRLKVLYNIRSYIDQELRLMLCETLILSKLSYCITVYGGCINRQSQRLIQRIQNSCARFCFFIPRRSHITPYLNKLSILKMESRQKLFLSCLLFDVIKYKQPDYLYNKLAWSKAVQLTKNRFCSNNIFCIPKHRTAAFRGGFKYRASKCWNDIPPPLRNIISKATFKRKLKQYLLSIQIEVAGNIHSSQSSPMRETPSGRN